MEWGILGRKENEIRIDAVGEMGNADAVCFALSVGQEAFEWVVLGQCAGELFGGLGGVFTGQK